MLHFQRTHGELLNKFFLGEELIVGGNIIIGIKPQSFAQVASCTVNCICARIKSLTGIATEAFQLSV